MTTETRKYIIRERVALSRLHQQALCRISGNTTAARKQPKINARTFRVLQRAGLVQFIVTRGPKGGRIVIDLLTEKGEQIVNRIHDECEGVDLSTGEYLFLVETLPYGMNDGDEVDENGRSIAARNAQLDAQERDTLQSTASAKRERMMQNAKAALDRVADSMQRNAQQLGEQLDKLATESKLSELLDQEAAQRAAVWAIERALTTTVDHSYRHAKLSTELQREIAALNSIRGQIVMLTPLGMKVQRVSGGNGRIEFVRI
jgi:hypothetical protein